MPWQFCATVLVVLTALCGFAMTALALEGSYVVGEQQAGFEASEYVVQGYHSRIVFAANGTCTYSFDLARYVAGVEQTPVSVQGGSCTYQADGYAPNRYYVYDANLAYLYTLQLSADGNSGVLGNAYSTTQQVAVKEGTLKNASNFSGTYLLSSQLFSPAGNTVDGGTAEVYSSGDGTCSFTSQVVTHDEALISGGGSAPSSPATSPCNYLVTASGGLVIQVSGATMVDGQLSADDNAVFAIEKDGPAGPGIEQIIGIRTTNGKTEASLLGDYQFTLQGAGFHDDTVSISRFVDAAVDTIQFFGNGNCEVRSSEGYRRLIDGSTIWEGLPYGPYSYCTYDVSTAGAFNVYINQQAYYSGTLNANASLGLATSLGQTPYGNGTDHAVVQVAALRSQNGVTAPSTLTLSGGTLPYRDADGSYALTWGASTSPQGTSLSYVLEERTDPYFELGDQTVYSNITTRSQPVSHTGPTTYYYRVKGRHNGALDSAWVYSEPIAVGYAANPTTITIPAGDEDGNDYTVYWDASTTEGATYLLEESTSPSFVVAQTQVVYSGPLTSVTLSGRAIGTYYYRIKSQLSGYADNINWKTANPAGCKIGPLVAPATITVQPQDADGLYTVSWTDALNPSTTGYILQEATDPSFSVVRELTTDPGVKSQSITGRTAMTAYYYRVKAVKDGYTPSDWLTGNTPCYVGSPAIPATLTVPTGDVNGTYTVSWEPSTTQNVPVTYVLEEDTSASFNTGNRRTAYTGSLSSAAITGRTGGSYYYRVKVQADGYMVSGWKSQMTPCVIGVLSQPNGLTIPAVDADGAFDVSWGAVDDDSVIYVLQEATNSSFLSGVTDVYTGPGLTFNVTGRAPATSYYYRVKATLVGSADSAWKQGTAPCNVGAPAAVATVTVPSGDVDGTYAVSWTASATTGVTYQVDESLDPNFASVETVYTGSALSTTVNGKAVGNIYYYRVMVKKTGFLSSAWTNGANGCAIGKLAAPATLNVPANDADGNFVISWTASTEAGVTYVLQEDTTGTFATGVTEYTSSTNSVNITGRPAMAKYYYQVKVTKPGAIDSEWKVAAAPCAVGSPAVPTGLVVPVGDQDGSYTVSWTASVSPDVTYTLEEATNTTFTAGTRTVASGITAVSQAIDQRTQGVTYYYRVKATLAGFPPSAWVTNVAGCKIGPLSLPGVMTVPAKSAALSYTVSWQASVTPGAKYEVQEATAADFLTGLRTVTPLDGTSSLSVSITGRTSLRTYYYRVRAIKPNFDYTPTEWVVAMNPCNVGAAALPAKITVPAGDVNGSYTVSWEASNTANVSYVLQEATNSTFTAGLRTAYAGVATSADISGRVDGVSYYYRVKVQLSGFADSAWKALATPCKVGTLAMPGGLTVPLNDADGIYDVSWVSSSNDSGVTYVLQEASNSSFTTGLQDVYTGTATSVTLSGRSSMTSYYYRVKAILAGYPDTLWKTGANSCNVGIPAAVAAVTVPTGDLDGSYTVKWTASTSLSVTYLVEESTDPSFVPSVTVYNGSALSVNLIDRTVGQTYYYRVKTQKTGFLAGVWKAGVNGCTVGTLAAPPSLTVPAKSATTSYTVSWTASTDAGVTYVLEEATSVDFTTGKRQVYSGSDKLSFGITGRARLTAYYYRIKAIKAGLADSAWMVGAVPCKVGSPALPATLSVPDDDEDGNNLVIGWTPSPDTGVTYVLQEATNTTFTTGLQTVYTGPALGVTLNGRLAGKKYFYRIKTQYAGFPDSAWKTDTIGCKVGPLSIPATLTVPVKVATGNYTISWGASSLSGVTYVLEEATDANFTLTKRVAYSGSSTSASISLRVNLKSYYYRVKATKPGYTDTAWKTAANPCNFGAALLPTTLTAPATNATGSYTVSWAASATPGVTYVLQEATNSTFTTGLRTVTAAPFTATSVNITGQAAGTYFYRVKVQLAGYSDSVWKSRTTACVVTLP